jgi:hypothetical protein
MMSLPGVTRGSNLLALLNLDAGLIPRWIFDWDEAARQPWKTRAFLAIGFAALGVLLAVIGGFVDWRYLAIGLSSSELLGVAIGEQQMRRR